MKALTGLITLILILVGLYIILLPFSTILFFFFREDGDTWWKWVNKFNNIVIAIGAVFLVFVISWVLYQILYVVGAHSFIHIF